MAEKQPLKFAYYPGCSLESALAKEFDESARRTAEHLGCEMDELHDWNCCGASSGHSTSRMLNHAIVGRNLALAEQQGLDIAAACPACYIRLKHTRQSVSEDAELKQQVIETIGMPYQGTYDVRHLLDIIVNDIGLDAVREKVVKPLTGLKLVSYYGCFLVRPPSVTSFDDPENPVTMDTLLESIGADVRDWTGKVDCCGGSLSLTKRDVVTGLVRDIIDQARDAGAEALVAACPLCNMNIDGRQSLSGNPLPVFYFTELMGLAMGLSGTGKWWKKHMVSPVNLLKKHRLIP
jgi:heterodisulfide reductase subunit B